MLKFLLGTGQRRGEVASMRRDDVDRDERLWTLTGSATKAGRVHVVALSPLAMEILEDLPRSEGGEFVFTATAGKKPVSGFSRAKQLADKAAGVSNWHGYDLRRTATTEMRRLGIGREVIGAVLNHARRGPAVDNVVELRGWGNADHDKTI